jgi:hypothetical protein
MSDPNTQFTRGFQGQGPPAGGSDLDEWAKGDATRKLNLSRLGQQAGGPSSEDVGSAPSHYTVPPNPHTLNIGLFLAGSFIVFCLSAPIFGTLYPVASGAALAAGLASDAFLRHVVPAWDGSDRVAISVPVAIAIFWIASRLDHRVAAYVPPYRWARHVARVVLVSALVGTASLNPERSLIPTDAYQLHAITSNPAFLPLIAVSAIVTHFALVRWASRRDAWDHGLEVWGLRPNGLPRPEGLQR